MNTISSRLPRTIDDEGSPPLIGKPVNAHTYPRWIVRPHHFQEQYSGGKPRIFNIADGQDLKQTPALVLSYELAEKLRNAMYSGAALRYTSDSERGIRRIQCEQGKIKAQISAKDSLIKHYELRLRKTSTKRMEKREKQLYDAYSKRSVLQQELEDLMAEGDMLERSVESARQDFEAHWTAVDLELRLVFANAGFTVSNTSSPNEANYPLLQTHKDLEEQISDPDLRRRGGYASTPVYIPREELQKVVPRLVLAAKTNLYIRRTDYESFRKEIKIDFNDWVRDNQVPTDSDTVHYQAVDKSRQTVWNKEFEVTAIKRVDARKAYVKAVDAAKAWGIDDLPSMTEISWISTGPDEDNRV